MPSRLLDILAERVLVFDGAMGTGIHARELALSDYRDLENCCEILVHTRPDVIEDIHRSFLTIGCDAVSTDTFGGSKHVLAEFGLADETRALNRDAARLARKTADEFSTPGKPRFVLGSVGPGTKLPSLGQTTFDALVDSYAEQCRGLLDGGVDALVIETCQDILQCKSAVVAAERAMAESGVTVPIICTITVETTGTMLVGTEVAAAVVALEPYDSIKVMGLNCATGPQEMSEHVRFLSRACDRPLLIQPNAGLPQLVDGRAHYALTPQEFTRWLVEFVEVDGVSAVGGCCGTTPEHLQALVEAIGVRAPRKRTIKREPAASSIYQAAALHQDNSCLCVGERTNANGSRKFREMLVDGDLDGMVRLARDQVQHGSHLLDVCTAYVGRDEVADMTALVRRMATEVTVPLMIDSTEPEVIEAALKLAGGRCIINSINLEDGEAKLDRICRLARRFGAAVVALTIDEEGMAKTADRKVAVARRILDLAVNRHGLRAEDLIFDALTFTICTGNEDDRQHGVETLTAIERIKGELPSVHTILGLSNISFGLKPAPRKVINSVFLHYAAERGLDAAIMHAGGIVPLYKIAEPQRAAAEDLIFDRRRNGYDPLQSLLGLFAKEASGKTAERTVPKSVEERLKRRIIDGDRTGLDEDLAEAMTTTRPLDIVNDILLDGMKTVGDLFGAGQMQLPFVLQSAETMKAAVAFLEPHMDRTEGVTRGTMVLATVRGDVHDIGKNLVDIILTNNGYTVHNLGIKQPISAIIDAYHRHRADAIGLSGLLVKSTVVMRENLEVLNERGLAPVVVLGGAALTRKYVEHDLGAVYGGAVHYAKDAFEGLHLMNRIAEAAEAAPDAAAPVAAAAPVSASAPPPPIAAPAVVTVEPVGAHPARSDIARDVAVPTPPFWGPRVVERFDLRAVLAYLNENMLFNVQWQYRKGQRSAEEFQSYVNSEVRPIYRELVEQCIREEILTPAAVYGYWPAQAEGDELIVWDADDRSREAARFEFPRQRKAPYWCLSDFFRPVDSGEYDVVAFMIVTVGRKASEVARQWFAEDRYRDYLHLHGLGVEAAEATAEFLHKQIRAELRIAGGDARDVQRLFQQRYQGSRYSFGYPACPRLEDQLKLWPLLDPERIDVTLSDEFQMEPEQSTNALICHHHQAKYFNVR